MAELIIKNLTFRGGSPEKIIGMTVPDRSFAAAVCDNAPVLFRIISGIESAPTGEIFLGGRNITGVEASKRNIALIFKNCTLYNQLTVYQNIAAHLRQKGTHCGSPRTKIETAAELFMFDDILDSKPASLNAEQKLRAELGRVSLLRPDLVLMHDPLKNICPERYDVMKAEMIRLYDLLGTSFLYITEDTAGGFARSEFKTINLCAAS